MKVPLKTILSHLPAEKQEDLHSIVKIIVEMTNPEMIILFGSHARGDWVNDRYTEDGITYTYKSDFDLLVIVEDEHKIKPSIEGKIRRKNRQASHHDTPVNVIFHEIGFVNKELEEGNYFFSDIKKEGILIYDTYRCTFTDPRNLTSFEAQKKAIDYFNFWFESANDFLAHYNYAFNDQKYNTAAFMLHQAAERFLVTTLLVFTCYKPKTHDLMLLYHDACRHGEKLRDIFPRNNNEENRLFNLLQKAYSDSRYKIDYRISEDDLIKLADRVSLLRILTEMYCNKKIKSIVL
jgi:HEPN domain-containing protein/predicted nucleotidyltransferase